MAPDRTRSEDSKFHRALWEGTGSCDKRRRWRKKVSSQTWPCGELRNLTAKYTKHGPRNICTQYNSQPRKKCKLVFAFSYSKQQNVSRWMEMQTCDWLNTGGHIKVTTNVLNYCIARCDITSFSPVKSFL